MRILPRHALIASLLTAGCGGLSAYYPEGRTADPDADTDTDTDSDTDSDTDTDTDTDSDTDTDTDLLPLTISTVDPAHGTEAGGQFVEITGTDFDSSAQVYFGSERATIASSGNNLLRVQTPPGEPGYTPIRVTTDTHTGSVDQAFYYWEDGEGLTGVLGSFEHYRYIGGYWADGTPPPEAMGDAFFVEPTDFEFWEFYAPSLGTCRSEYSYSGSITVYTPDISRFTLRRGSSSALNLFRSPDYEYLFETQGNVASQYANSAAYSLESDGGEEWPAFTLSGALSTPGSFSITSPNLGCGSVSATCPPEISRTNFRLQWSGSGGDYMIARLILFTAGGDVDEVVTCAFPDTNSFLVPSTAFNRWTSFTSGRQLTVILGRAVTGRGTLPHNRSSSGMVGIQWLIGAGFTQ